MDKPHAKIQFYGYEVEYMEFKLNPNYGAENAEIEMDIGFKHGYAIDTDNKKFDRILSCEIFKDYIEGNHPFYLKINLVGKFSYESEVKEMELDKMLKVNSTSILFPYLRVIISTVTTMFSVGSVILPTINIVALLEE